VKKSDPANKNDGNAETSVRVQPWAPPEVSEFVAAFIQQARGGNPDRLVEHLEMRLPMTEELYAYLAGVLSGKEGRPIGRPRRNRDVDILADLIDWPTWDKNTAKDVARKYGVSVATVNRLRARAAAARKVHRDGLPEETQEQVRAWTAMHCEAIVSALIEQGFSRTEAIWLLREDYIPLFTRLFREVELERGRSPKHTRAVKK
jgi:hypothetical protein